MSSRSFPLDASALWADLQSVRAQGPLVHNITNYVVMNYSANALLALGASPVMAHAPEEVEDMVALAGALVLNIGTLDNERVAAMALALRAARRRDVPVVLDPVGVGATPYRKQALSELLQAGAPTVVRGNASEVMSVAGAAAHTRGVDSSASSNDAAEAARALASDLNAIVCVSGAVDHVLAPDGRHARLANGHPWMTRVTGVGCSASAMVAAFAAVQPDPWRATVAAMAMLGVVGELAVERVQAAGAGLGRLQIELLDGLQLLREDEFLSRLRFQS